MLCHRLQELDQLNLELKGEELLAEAQRYAFMKAAKDQIVREVEAFSLTNYENEDVESYESEYPEY